MLLIDEIYVKSSLAQFLVSTDGHVCMKFYADLLGLMFAFIFYREI